MGFQILKIIYKLFILRIIQKKPNNILVVAEYGNYGGTRTYLFYLLKFFYSYGANVTLLLSADQKDDELLCLLKVYNFKTLETNFDFWCTDLNDNTIELTKREQYIYEFKELKFWCDIQKNNKFSTFIFTHNYPGKYLTSLLIPVKLFYIIHSVPLVKIDSYKNFLLKRFLSTKKQIVTVSQYAKSTIEKQWFKSIPNPYLTWIYNYYAPKFPILNNSKSKSVKTILTIGSLEKYKNPMFFIETAIQLIQDNKGQKIKFIWAGDGSMLEECRKAVYGIAEITFVGHIEDVEALYSKATIYFQPSILESHGIAVIGAMYHHLPCVVSDNGGMIESVTNERTGFVVPVETIDLAVEKISWLLDNPEECGLMGNRGYEVYKKKFNPHTWEIKMYKFLDGSN